MNAILRYREILSPVGKLRLVATSEALVEIFFCTLSAPRSSASNSSAKGAHSVLDQAERQLHEYFAGQRRSFDLPLAPNGTDFQKKVWDALRGIPHGQTTTYGEIAKVIGKPRASRAVGGANNKNPLAIVIPCHRVVGSNGSLTGYAGGLTVKEKLLALEADSHASG